MTKKNTKHHQKNSQKPSQVRIIGGQYKRRLVSFIEADGLRPTPDRLRETIFNWLLANIHDGLVLDVCAGSGVLGFEALSRGAKCVTMIEKNIKQIDELTKSINLLNIHQNSLTLIHGCAKEVLKTLDTPFDVIFLDPPYSLDLWATLLNGIIDSHLYHNDSLIYIESDKPLELCVQGIDVTFVKRTKIGQVYAGIIKINARFIKK